jgi:hypothetical protein
MSQTDKLTGIDSRGTLIPLIASISHPDKDTVQISWRYGFDATYFTVGGETRIAVSDGIDTVTFKVELRDSEEVIHIERNLEDRYIKVHTRVR